MSLDFKTSSPVKCIRTAMYWYKQLALREGRVFQEYMRNISQLLQNCHCSDALGMLQSHRAA